MIKKIVAEFASTQVTTLSQSLLVFSTGPFKTLEESLSACDAESCVYFIENGLGSAATVSESGRTALHAAGVAGKAALLAYLLKIEADVRAADGDLNTALHLASANGHTAAVRVLVEKGADLKAII
jgi:hypothetical protein